MPAVICGTGLRFRAEAPALFGIGALLFFLALAVHYLLDAFESSRDAERKALELKVLARETELKILKAQIDPHFLFNSLNSISALTSRDPSGARQMCLLLADFLRKTLSLAGLENITLAEEVSLSAGFLNIEKARFGPRLHFEQDMDDACGNLLVPPLLLQPLVENAVKHGIARLIDGGTVRLEAKRAGERLRVAVENPCDPERPPRHGKGVGLRNVRERIQNHYGLEARIDILESPGRYRVELLLPAQASTLPAESEETAPAISVNS